MCGIAGGFGEVFPSFDGVSHASRLLSHRGPDDEGYAIFSPSSLPLFLNGPDSAEDGVRQIMPRDFEAPTTGILLHRRLSIIDLTATGHQPMSSADLQQIIVLNGEVYNYIELREELIGLGHAFRGSSDTEVVLAAYRQWGTDAFERFIGMWGLAIFDAVRNRLVLSRDRFGIKPLFVCRVQGAIWFASEIKAIWALSGQEPVMEPAACKDYILYGEFGTEQGTMFRSIDQIPPGTSLVYDVGADSCRMEQYYDLPSRLHVLNDDARLVTPADAMAALEESVRIHFRSDVEIGTCLSGGLDSTTLTWFARENLAPGSSIHSFSAVYPGEAFDEQSRIDSFLSAVERVRPTFTYPDFPTLMRSYSRLVWHQELPFNSTSIFAQWEVMRAARGAGLKVLIDGQGADEVCAGYYPFAGVYLMELLRAFRLRAAFIEYRLLRKRTNSGAGLYTVAALLENIGLRGILGRPVGKSTHRLLSREGLNLRGEEPPARWGTDVTDHSIRTMRFGLQQLLRYEDRNSMAFSIESRVPFLDHRFVETVLALPSNVKIVDGYLKAFLRTSMSDRLPADIVWQIGKTGFTTPQARWRQLLSDEDMARAIEGLCGTEIADEQEFTRRQRLPSLTTAEESEFWRMYTLGIWYNVVMKEWRSPPEIPKHDPA